MEYKDKFEMGRDQVPAHTYEPEKEQEWSEEEIALPEIPRYPFWQFLVRGIAHSSWTATALMFYYIFPDPFIATVLFVLNVIGHFKLVSLFDYIFEEMEDGEDE